MRSANARGTHLRATLAAALLAFFVAVATAQETPAPVTEPLPAMSDAAAEALEAGRAAMAEALATYPVQYPDRPLWQEAFRQGRLAMQIAPERPEPLRFLAEAYSRANWYGPAWQAWNDYLARGYPLDPDATSLFVEVGSQLGFLAYQQGNLEQAADYYRRIIEVVPYAYEPNTWLGRILLEQRKPAQAIVYWQTAVERNPMDDRAQYFLQLARDQAHWGVDAVNAFREGVAFYEQGDLVQARERFARATEANDFYPEAWAWLGRVEFEQGNYLEASLFYQRAARLAPDNATYRYFYEESERRLQAAAEAAAAEAAAEETAAEETAAENESPASPDSNEETTEPAGNEGN